MSLRRQAGVRASRMAIDLLISVHSAGGQAAVGRPILQSQSPRSVSEYMLETTDSNGRQHYGIFGGWDFFLDPDLVQRKHRPDDATPQLVRIRWTEQNGGFFLSSLRSADL